jgi:spore germination cell wall hydrolase CwlJ-like protein
MTAKKIVFSILALFLVFFVFNTEDIIDNRVEIDNDEVECLARNIYFEARNQPIEGQEAVAHVTLNRLKSGKHGDSICQVVYQPYAFSWTLKSKAVMKEIKAEALARDVAFKTLLGHTKDPTNGATHYHATYVTPHWSKKLEKKVKISSHIL